MAPPSKYNKLQGKHILIIGGSSGIGFGVAEASVAASAGTVTISSSSQTKIDTATSQLKEIALPEQAVQGFRADLSGSDAEAQLDAMFKQATANGNPINHIVLTAADALSLLMLQDLTEDKILAASHMRLVVPLLVVKVAARYLPRTRESSITLTSGSAAWKGTPGWSIVSYFAAGYQGLTRQLAVELKPVRVNCVAPGYTDTGLWSGMGEAAKEGFVKHVESTVPTGTFGQVEDVVESYIGVMKDGNATGSVVASDSGSLVV